MNTHIFDAAEQSNIGTLGRIARRHLDANDKRVANAISEAFQILRGKFRSDSRRAEAAHEFKKLFGMGVNDAVDEFMVACYNTAQYERGLDMCDIAETYQLSSADEVASERAQLHGHLGEFSKAERILSGLVERHPSDVSHYISYGDLYYVWQVLPEKQDLHKAERWYYRAFDRQLGAGTEAGFDLLERLGDVCVERLRRSAEKRFLEMMRQLAIGDWLALQTFKQSVYGAGPESPVFNHLQMEISHKAKDIKQTNSLLGVLTNAYNLMPQRTLDDLCPFQMAEYYAQGEHVARIVSEKFEAFQRAVERNEVSPPTGAEGAEAFSDFQKEFMNGIDQVTGEKRRNVLEKEHKRIAKLMRNGEFVWTGFVKFRGINDLPEVPLQ